MRLLERLRPHVDVAELEVLALPGERSRCCPGLDDQLVRLAEARAGVRRVDVVRKELVAGAHHLARDHPPAADDVEHGDLFGHPQRVVVQRQHVAQNDQFGVRRSARQTGGHDVGRRHQAVRVLVMLVDAHAVESELVGQLQLIQVAVVDLVAALSVVQVVLAHDPGRVVVGCEIGRQVRPRHQVKREEAHPG